MRFVAFVFTAAALMAAPNDAGFNGRWDITIPRDPRNRAWWLEVEGAGTPQIRDADEGSWKRGKTVELFNGRDLSRWESRIPGRPVQWAVKESLLSNEKGAADIVSTGKFWNFELHVEYRIGQPSNSGIGLGGRYKVQIFDDYGHEASLHGNGALDSRIVPTMNASRPPGEWQTFDIRLIGRTVTVVLNDRKIIDQREIEGLTAIASDPNEAEPGRLCCRAITARWNSDGLR